MSSSQPLPDDMYYDGYTEAGSIPINVIESQGISQSNNINEHNNESYYGYSGDMMIHSNVGESANSINNTGEATDTDHDNISQLNDNEQLLIHNDNDFDGNNDDILSDSMLNDQLIFTDFDNMQQNDISDSEIPNNNNIDVSNGDNKDNIINNDNDNSNDKNNTKIEDKNSDAKTKPTPNASTQQNNIKKDTKPIIKTRYNNNNHYNNKYRNNNYSNNNGRINNYYDYSYDNEFETEYDDEYSDGYNEYDNDYYDQNKLNTFGNSNRNKNLQNWQKTLWKDYQNNAKKLFMPLPHKKFKLIQHYEIEQVLRKQISHMMIPDPFNADFYCQVRYAKEGKPFVGFGFPGVNSVLDHTYPKNNDGSPILPPGMQSV